MRDQELPFAEMRRELAAEFTYKPWIYWTDFLVSVALGWSAFIGQQMVPLFSAAQVGLYFLALLATYRAVLFVHEIAHFKKNSVPGFSAAWNLLMGIPFFVPSFMYRGVHNDHHSKLFYGTKEDGEYVAFGVESPKRILLYLATTIVSPLLLPLRFIVLTPLSWLIPSFRKIVVGQLSSLVIDFEYVRGELSPSEKKDIRWQEPLAFIFGAILVALIVAKVLPVSLLAFWYFHSFGLFLINSLRTIAAHRYTNAGEEISMSAQFLDSVNIVGAPISTAIFCPVGLRFHALHHLFPTLPYHSLASAHKRLENFLPKNSPYHLASEESLASAIASLWKSAKTESRKPRSESEKTSLVPNFLHKNPSESRPRAAKHP
jgi:fatty acid desaturase